MRLDQRGDSAHSIAMLGEDHDFSHLDRAGRAAASVARRPRVTVNIVVGAGIILAWLLLGTMAIRGAETRGPGIDAPGDTVLRYLPHLPLPDVLDRIFALCLTPAPLDGAVGAQSRSAYLDVVPDGGRDDASFRGADDPHLLRDCRHGSDQGRTGRPSVGSGRWLPQSWLAASTLFAALTLGVHAFASSGQLLDPVVGLAGAAALLVAGLYQFSGLKDACLKKCKNPFSILFSNWSARPARIFRLGLEQGVWCLGCCWALMLVMFAVGAMNVFWMVLIAFFTLIEKQTASRLPTRLAGAILLVWATALLVVSA